MTAATQLCLLRLTFTALYAGATRAPPRLTVRQAEEWLGGAEDALHQKVMFPEDCWCAVGSTNFDDRSFETNDEITLGILDRELAQRLEGIFLKYVQRAQEVRLEVWRRRWVWHCVKNHAAYAVNEVL